MKGQPHIFTKDNFYSGATGLRKHFEKRMGKPLQGSADRFVWDYWYVKNQYNLIRTPASEFFPESEFTKFQDFLVRWGQQNLGCHSISTPWLSYYIDGCYMDWHADIPHGPWAYVFSLSPRKIKYQGGETLILKPEVLSFWNNFDAKKGLERAHMIDRIDAKFNRLVAFDPRFPHSVSEVRGVRDPLEARLVIHGWFVQPLPFVEGSLKPDAIGDQLGDLVDQLSRQLMSEAPFVGTLCLRISINPKGEVNGCKILTMTLIDQNLGWCPKSYLNKSIAQTLAQTQFPKSKGKSEITIPLIFE